MGKFYRDTHAAAKAAKEALESTRSTRAAAKAVDDAVKAAITAIAGEGKFQCLFVGVPALATTETVRRGGTNGDRIEVVECPPELVEAIGNRLARPISGFAVTNTVINSEVVKRVSWEVEEAEPAPTP